MHPEQCYSAHTSQVTFEQKRVDQVRLDDAVQQQNRGDNPLKSAHILNTQSLRNQAGGDPPAGSTAEEKIVHMMEKFRSKNTAWLNISSRNATAQKSGNEYQALQGKLFQA